ncbi:hypothetical protein EDD18DRAFT_1352653 [Armillaria luteobubalina]|uniref:Uncharacterized protein n=1 Tax=Armillaria luteobubalina TaxID=153913 RepID=A0AA39Q5U1_9AGAR|nr:hypothetical protein EDD18DRAFT_1352653 [Armillaria luteobubalina]
MTAALGLDAKAQESSTLCQARRSHIMGVALVDHGSLGSLIHASETAVLLLEEQHL